MKRRKMTEEKAELPPEVGQVESKIKLGNGGKLVVNNRAFRRAWRNRAMLEGKPSKKWFTTKKTKCRRKREQRNRQAS